MMHGDRRGEGNYGRYKMTSSQEKPFVSVDNTSVTSTAHT